MAVVGATALIASLMLAPTASANGPNGAKIGPAHPATTLQSAAWLAAKNDYRIVSGLKANQGKHGQAHPTVLAASLINLSAQASYLGAHHTGYSYPPVSGEPSSYILYNGSGVEYVAEPGDGNHPNLPDGTQYADDAGHSYSDGFYFTLCGPGAADVTMFWWPYPSNDSTHTTTDTLPGSHTTGALTWYGEDGSSSTGTIAYRLRGYMSYLAFGINNVPGWSGRALLPQSYYQTGIDGGATLQAMQQVMNWEASSENSSTWTNYFYVVTWNNSVSNIGVTLHNDIVTDIASSKVPMVVEVDAKDLPNWNTTHDINHFIAITGYDDTTGNYYYFDTCKQFTNCDGGGSNTPDLHSISQTQLTTAVSAIPTNQSTGDGGWIW